MYGGGRGDVTIARFDQWDRAVAIFNTLLGKASDHYTYLPSPP